MMLGEIKITRSGPCDEISFAIDTKGYKCEIPMEAKANCPSKQDEVARYTIAIYEDDKTELRKIERMLYSSVWERKITRTKF